MKFFVYIVESPSPVDFYNNRHEGDLLARAVGLDSIQCVVRIAISREAFEAAIKHGLPQAMQAFPGLLPILHLSAHGGNEGIQLSDGEIISWHDLKSILMPVNKALNGHLLLCMSSCEGIAASSMALQQDGDHPFFAVVGHLGKPTWSDTAVAYACFYHLIAKGEYVATAVDAMRIAAGDDRFTEILASEVRKVFIDCSNELNAQSARTTLQREAEGQPPAL